MINEKLNRAVGYAALLLVSAAVFWVLVLGDKPLTPVVRFKVKFDRVGQLEPGASVKIGSMEVGRVSGIHFSPAKTTGTSKVADDPETESGFKDNAGVGEVVVSVWVRNQYRKFVRMNSLFYVSSASLIGARHLEIAFPEDEPERVVRDGDVFIGEPPAHMDRMLIMVYDNLKMATDLMDFVGPDLSAVRSRFESLEEMLDIYEGDMVLFTKLGDQSKEIWDDLKKLKAALESGTQKGEMIKGPVRKLKRVAERFSERMEGLEEKGNRLSTLFNERRTEFASLGLNKHVSETEKNLRAVFSVLGRVRKDLDTIVDAVIEGKGTIGALARDREMHHDFQESQKTILHAPWRVLGRPEKMSVDGLPGP